MSPPGKERINMQDANNKNMAEMSSISRIFSLFKEVKGSAIDVNKYEDRLAIQKLTYMLKTMGISSGYRFTWYIKGPYSPVLSSEAFSETGKASASQPVALSLQETEKCANLKVFLGKDVKDSNKMELYASLLFLKKDEKITERPAIIAKLTTLKPWFTKEQAEEALDKIEKSGIF